MAGPIITPADLAKFGLPDDEKTAAMIEDALAQAVLVAPCLEDNDLDAKLAAGAKAILRGAIVRWHEAGAGAIVTRQESTGPFNHSETIDTSRKRKGAFWPSEITDLQQLCKTSKAKAFTIEMQGGAASPHLPWCDVMFGGTSCSCGASIAGAPIYELG